MAMAINTAAKADFSLVASPARKTRSIWSRMLDRLMEARMQEVRRLLVQRGYGAYLAAPVVANDK